LDPYFAGIGPTGKKAHWTAAAIFELDNGKIKTFVKEWDKLAMWRQFGWPENEATKIESA
jgi:predicted ester cyclase